MSSGYGPCMHSPGRSVCGVGLREPQMSTRSLLDHERPLVAYLFELAGLPVDLDALQVAPMDDGGMGSLEFVPLSRRFGSAAAECHFRDADGALVSAVLNLDPEGLPFEVDVWRFDYAPLVAWPDRADLHAGAP